jgi:cardiolipin synthase
VYFAVLLYRFAHYFPIVNVLSFIISVLIILALIKKDETSAFKMAWIIVVMAMPFIGSILYLLFGHKRSTKRLRERIDKERDAIVRYLRQSHNPPADSFTQDDRMAGCLHYIQRASHFNAYQNTDTKYYPFGELMFEDMLAGLRSAKKFIFMEYFIISKGEMWDKILEVLIDKARGGVDVRLIYDDMGSLSLFSRSYLRKLRAANIKIVTFNPFVPLLSLVMNYRNHRKITVIDGNIGFNGGINIADEYINKDNRLGVWKDTGIRLEGDAVWSFTLLFIETWNAFSRPEERISDYASYKNTVRKNQAGDELIMPYGDSPLDPEQIGENVYIEILNQSRRYVYIFTPYLIISDKMIYALQMASKRGVDVRIATPGIPDKKLVFRVTRSYYNYLLKAGIRIFEYTPGFLHAKNFVCDDEIAVVGTINLDYRSLYHNFECATFLYKADLIKEIKEDAIQTMADGREISLADRRQRFLDELFDEVLHLFTPLM